MNNKKKEIISSLKLDLKNNFLSLHLFYFKINSIG